MDVLGLHTGEVQQEGAQHVPDREFRASGVFNGGTAFGRSCNLPQDYGTAFLLDDRIARSNTASLLAYERYQRKHHYRFRENGLHRGCASHGTADYDI